MKRKKIDLLSPPFKGHLHPILAIGRILSKDHEVTVLSSQAARADIEAAGLSPLILSSIDDKSLIECVNPAYPVHSSPKKLFNQFRQVLAFFQQLKSELENIYLKRKPDLLIADFTLPVAGFIAQRHGIPWWTSMPSPCVIECPGGTPSYLGGWKEGSSLMTKFRDFLGRAGIRSFKSLVAYFCKKPIRKLGLEKIYRRDGTEAIYSDKRILCLGYRELEFSKPWPKSVRFIGPMLYSPKLSLESPHFEANKQYVLITLGTHLDWCKAKIYREIEVLADQFPNFVFHFSQGNIHSSKLLESNNRCFSFPYINYEEHLPKYDGVIHHAGAGIMYYCIQLGKPSIVIPQDYDQFDHAARLEGKGLAIWVKNSTQLPMALEALIANKARTRKTINDFRDHCKSSQHNGSILELLEQI